MNYTQISEKVAQWMNRDDLTALIPDFIELAEERLNRALRVRQMEVALTATPIVDNIITPAVDVLDAKALWVPNYERTPLVAQGLESVVAAGAEGIPTMYAWDGANFRFDGGGDVQGVLYQRIPALATAGTNWVSEGPWSLYLFGALLEAAIYVQEDLLEAKYIARFGQTVAEVQGNDQRRPGALVARPR